MNELLPLVGHNLLCGRHMEALAHKLRGRAAFVHVNRDRIDTAFSLAYCNGMEVPVKDPSGGAAKKCYQCARGTLIDGRLAPNLINVSNSLTCCVCVVIPLANMGCIDPNDREWWPLHPNADSNLKVGNEQCKAMSKFQGRLWRVDELQSRWNKLKASFANVTDAPVFEEITWMGGNITMEHFVLPVVRLAGLDIDEAIKLKVPIEKAHTPINKHGRDYQCLLDQDRKYKELMGYSEEQIVDLQPLTQSNLLLDGQLVI